MVKTLDIVDVKAYNEDDAIKIVRGELYKQNPRGLFEIDIVTDVNSINNVQTDSTDI